MTSYPNTVVRRSPTFVYNGEFFACCKGVRVARDNSPNVDERWGVISSSTSEPKSGFCFQVPMVPASLQTFVVNHVKITNWCSTSRWMLLYYILELIDSSLRRIREYETEISYLAFLRALRRARISASLSGDGGSIGRSKDLLSLLYIGYWAIFVDTNDPNSVIHNRVAEVPCIRSKTKHLCLFGNSPLHNLKDLGQVGCVPRNCIAPLVHNVVSFDDKGSSQLQNTFGDTRNLDALFNR
jgi:hypothetical protein